MDLSILDVLPITSGRSAAEALASAGDLARLGDRRGYTRLWYAEHHGMRSIASTSPELLIAHVGALTQRIRLGAGGVMLPNHVPLRVVEQYRTLAALFPGRVDLGLGRAAGTDPLTARALRSSSGGPRDGFEHLLAELLAFEGGHFPAGHPFGRVHVTPEGVPLPPLWMLGSSGGSATLAGEIGAGYAFATHFSPMPAAGPVRAYRAAFTPSSAFPRPHVILAVHALCAPTGDEVEELALPVRYALTQLALGGEATVLTPDEARAAGFDARAATGPMARLLLAGTPDAVRAHIEALASEVAADEVMVMTLSHDPAARLRSYELLADAFALPTHHPT